MIQVVDSHAGPIMFGSLESDLASFVLEKEKNDSSHLLTEEKLLHKGEDSTFIFGNAEDDGVSAKNDYLLISDYLSAKNDYLVSCC